MHGAKKKNKLPSSHYWNVFMDPQEIVLGSANHTLETTGLTNSVTAQLNGQHC